MKVGVFPSTSHSKHEFSYFCYCDSELLWYLSTNFQSSSLIFDSLQVHLLFGPIFASILRLLQSFSRIYSLSKSSRPLSDSLSVIIHGLVESFCWEYRHSLESDFLILFWTILKLNLIPDISAFTLLFDGLSSVSLLLAPLQSEVASWWQAFTPNGGFEWVVFMFSTVSGNSTIGRSHFKANSFYHCILSK